MRVDDLTLREATAEDVELLMTCRNDPDVNRFMMRTSVEAEHFRTEWLAVPGSETDYSCVAERDGQVVAMGFLEVQDGSGQPGMPTRTEGLIGYVVDPSAWRTGVATTLTKGLLAAAFDHLALRRVVAYCNADNTGSVRALEKAGMRREQHGVEDSWHAELGWVDGYQYALLRREWPARQGADGSLSTPVLETDRLRLRPVTADDEDAVCALMSDPVVLRYWDSPPWPDRSPFVPFVDRSRRLAAEGGGVRLVVEGREDGRFVGWCGLSSYDEDFRSVELTYVLAREVWGRGYATEAVGALVGWAYDTLDLNRVHAVTDTRNAASGRVLEKLGFVLEGTVREDCVVDGVVSDSWVYGLLRREWRARLESQPAPPRHHQPIRSARAGTGRSAGR